DRLLQKPPTAATAKEHATHESEAQIVASKALLAAIGADYGGLRLRGRAVSVVMGQIRRLDKALTAEAKSTTPAEHQKLLTMTEAVLLAFVSGLRALGARDAKSVAKRLADVADDGASAAAALAGTAEVTTPLAKLDAAVRVLGGGGKQLLRLGDLGLDLGEIV